MLVEICKLVKESGATDVHLYGEQPVFYRANGEIRSNNKIIVSESDIKKIILETSSAKAREILGHTKHVTYAADIEGIGRLRFAVFFDRGHFAIAIRFIKDKLYELSELGINETLRKQLTQRAGLILIGSTSGEGKSTTIASLVNYFNLNFEKTIVTVENPVEYLFKDKKSSIIQRSIPIDTKNYFTGVNEAGRIRPDIVVSESLGYPDVFDEALSLCEAGITVIGGTGGGDCRQILERIINSRPAGDRDLLRSRLASSLTMVLAQRLVPITQGERKAIFDIMSNTAQLRALIRNNNFTMFRTLQEQGKAAGMKTFDSQLLDLLRKNLIKKSDALKLAIEKQHFI